MSSYRAITIINDKGTWNRTTPKGFGNLCTTSIRCPLFSLSISLLIYVIAIAFTTIVSSVYYCYVQVNF